MLEQRAAPMMKRELLDEVNVRPGQLEGLLKVLEVEGAVERDGSRWLRTLTPWTFDHERVSSVTALRRTEQQQMLDYIGTDQCRMRLLRGYLDDHDPEPCGICDNCTGVSLDRSFDPATVQQAIDFLRKSERRIEPRKQLPDGKADRSRTPARGRPSAHPVGRRRLGQARALRQAARRPVRRPARSRSTGPDPRSLAAGALGLSG